MKHLILIALKKMGVSLSGPLGWVASLILDRFVIWAEKQLLLLVKNLNEYFRHKKQEKIDEKNQEKYEQVVGPESAPSQQELDDATSDLLNGRQR